MTGKTILSFLFLYWCSCCNIIESAKCILQEERRRAQTHRQSTQFQSSLDNRSSYRYFALITLDVIVQVHWRDRNARRRRRAATRSDRLRNGTDASSIINRRRRHCRQLVVSCVSRFRSFFRCRCYSCTSLTYRFSIVGSQIAKSNRIVRRCCRRSAASCSSSTASTAASAACCTRSVPCSRIVRRLFFFNVFFMAYIEIYRCGQFLCCCETDDFGLEATLLHLLCVLYLSN